MLERGGESLRCIAAYHVGELRPRRRCARGWRRLRRRRRELLPRRASSSARSPRCRCRPGARACLSRARPVAPLERMLHIKRVPMLAGLPNAEVAMLADAAVER